ncbi:MAG: tetratricopeptide repeat protein [Bacteroidota bacterium]
MATRLRPFLFLGLAAVLAAGVYLWRASQTEPAPLPDDLEQVAPSASFDNVEESVEYYREKVRRNPDDVQSRVRLAQALTQLARETGDEFTLIPEAVENLEAALELDPDHYHGRTLWASTLNKLHRFEDARDLARELIAEYPSHSYTRGVLVDALVELGEYEEAVAQADEMVAIRPGLPAYARISYLRELHGDAQGAIQAMTLAAQAEAPGRDDRSWALHTLAGLYMGEAALDSAETVYNGILEEAPGFAPALAGLGHIALARGDAQQAIARIEEARGFRADGSFDELLVEAYAMAGDEAKSREAAERVYEELLGAREMGEIVDMEEADFLLDQDRDLERSLRLAQEQQARRPGHMHANETLAWALMKNGRAQEGIPYIERAMRLDTGDAMVHYRAARIYEAAGNAAEAARHLRIALDGNVGIESPTTEQEARALLASMGDAPPVQTTSAR